MVIVVEHAKFRALLMGDAELAEISALLAAEVISDVDLLKAGHHGSRNGVTPLLLQRAKPEVVVISVGRTNDYGHPSPMALRYYSTSGRRVLRTDLNGDVSICVDAIGDYRVDATR